MAHLGFGTYRVLENSPQHQKAFEKYLAEAPNASLLIDTSTNYGNGSAERFIGASQLLESRQQAKIVTKVGYVQGDNLETAKTREAEGRPYPEMVKYSEDCWHCISPEFIRDQIERSLGRLKRTSVDFVLLHNPEYFLYTVDRPAEYYRRIAAAFEVLEQEVEAGRVGAYGISSNTFPDPADSFHFTALDQVWGLAQNIHSDSHFRVIQFPFNLVESGAFLEPHVGRQSLIEFARSKDLLTLANRPLNARFGDGMLRLADFPNGEASEFRRNYVERLKLLMSLEIQFQDMKQLENLQLSWGHVLAENLSSGVTGDHWRFRLEQHIFPQLEKSLAWVSKNPTRQEWVNAYREIASSVLKDFDLLSDSRLFLKSHEVRKFLELQAPELNEISTLSGRVLALYQALPDLDFVLLGARKLDYVQDALSVFGSSPRMYPESALKVLKNFQDFKKTLSSP